MLTNSKIAFLLALFVATASGAVAAPTHAVRHQTATVLYVPAAAYQSFGLKSYPVMLQQGFGNSASRLGPTDPTNGVAR
jgi:hypothetical protein